MKTFAVKYKDSKVIENSRSGGAFTAFSNLFINKTDGVIYGCVLDENCIARHIRTENESGRNRMRGSKYVQSNMGNCFQKVKKDLTFGRQVLFTGTSCQVAGLRNFLGKDYDNLLCIDIVCHGVPSPKVLNKYLLWVGNVNFIDFRNKNKFGWRDHVETLSTDKGEINSRVWANIFYSGNALRPSCYKCKFKSIQHPGDVTIADYWGIEKNCPQFDDNKGVSLVLVNTKKGQQYFDLIKCSVKWKETKIEHSMQRAFIRSEPLPTTREQFWKDFKSSDFSLIAKKYGGYSSFGKRIIRKIQRKIMKLLTNFFLL